MWLSGLSAGLQNKGSLVLFPVRAQAWVVGQLPSRGHLRGNHTLMFFSLSFSLLSPLSKNKLIKYFFKKRKVGEPRPEASCSQHRRWPGCRLPVGTDASSAPSTTLAGCLALSAHAVLMNGWVDRQMVDGAILTQDHSPPFTSKADSHAVFSASPFGRPPLQTRSQKLFHNVQPWGRFTIPAGRLESPRGSPQPVQPKPVKVAPSQPRGALQWTRAGP